MNFQTNLIRPGGIEKPVSGALAREATGAAIMLDSGIGAGDAVAAEVGETATAGFSEIIAVTPRKKPMPTLAKGKIYAFDSIWGTSPRDVWVTAVADGGSSIQDVLFRFDGSAWSQVSAGIVGEVPRFGKLWGRSASDLWLVGSDSTQTRGMIKHFDGTTWKTEYLGVRNISSIYAASPTSAWATAGLEGVLRFDGTNWNAQPGALPFEIFGLAVVGAAFLLSWAAEVAQHELQRGGSARPNPGATPAAPER